MKRFIPVLLLLAACAPALRVPTAEDAARGKARWPDYGESQLAEGHRLYILRCSSCHSLRLPQAHASSDFVRVFPKMRVKAKLTDGEAALILRYLIVMSRDGGASAGSGP